MPLLRHRYCKMISNHLFNRRLSTIIPLSEINKEKQMFQDSRKYIISAIETNEKLKQQPEVCTWVQKIFDYNTSGNHKMRGLTSVFTYKLLEKPENITEEKLKLVRIIAWTIEMFQAYIILLDDVMDGSTTRRGKPCWYRIPGVDLGALNDSTLLYCTVNDVLKEYFDNTKYYPSILHLFNEVVDIILCCHFTQEKMLCAVDMFEAGRSQREVAADIILSQFVMRRLWGPYWWLQYVLYSSIGQYMDLKKVYQKQKDYNLFTVELYESIIQFKSTIFSIELPVLAAMLLVEDRDKLPVRDIKKICCDIGTLLQLQNDILDCYGDKTLGKDGRDIQEGKCTWLAVQALKRCDPAQRAVFAECYGSQNPKHVEQIKLLYDELHLLYLFREEESKKFACIMEQIRELPAEVSPSIFYHFADTYKEKSLSFQSA